MRVLLVEDDKMLGKATRDGLKEIFAVDWVQTVASAEATYQSEQYDLVILDVSLPDGSGLDVLKRIRAARKSTPVMLLTARDAVPYRIEGLNAGADDYVVKPFDIDELIARCTALIRRSQGVTTSIISWGDIAYDAASLIATMKGQPVHLSRRELSVLQCLMSNIGKIVSKSQIESSIYDWDTEVESNAIEVHISSLRRKFSKDFIRTIRGVGYLVPAIP